MNPQKAFQRSNEPEILKSVSKKFSFKQNIPKCLRKIFIILLLEKV